MAHGLIAAGGTGVVLVATRPMRPAVVAGEWGPCAPYPSRRICWSHQRIPPPFCPGRHVYQLLVCCCEHCDRGCEGQVGHPKLLEDGCVVRPRKS
jgi:hypothetical protein